MATEYYHSAMATRFACQTQPIPNSQRRLKVGRVACRSSRTIKSQSTASMDEDEQPQYWKKVSRKAQRPYRPLIKVSTSDGRYQGEWTSEYALRLSQLRLSDLIAQDGSERDADVFVGLSVQKHAGFGFSIEGRVRTCFTSVCSSCFCSYHREIDTPFNVWVLPASRNDGEEMPEIGVNDPSLSFQTHPLDCTHFYRSVSCFSNSDLLRVPLEKTLKLASFLQVIYVKPGSEADLDSLIRDTIRLTASAKDTCSKACERSTPRWQYTDGEKTYDKRWSKLLQFKKGA